MPTVYLICGNTGAGKSTYSIALAKEKKALLFAIDPWMQTLYGDDYNPPAHGMDWLLPRTERCKTLMRDLAEQALGLGTDIVLDMTFGTRQTRRFYREWAEGLGAAVSIHFLDVDPAVRRQRVHKRNKEQGETFQFTVTDEMFDYVEGLFETPVEEEMAGGERITD